MKTSKYQIGMLVCFALGCGINFAQEPSPREQFQTAVAAFQKSATEDNARKLAELYKQLDPPPAVPEDAEFRALKGAAFVKQAGDAAAFAKAATEFSAAVAIAPWMGEYHYNLAVCEKSAGHFSAAQTALKLAQILARDDKERRDCLALRADLEAAQELATTKEAEVTAKQQSKQTAVANERKAFEGHWIQSTSRRYSGGDDAPLSLAVTEFDVSFDAEGGAKVIVNFRQLESGRWIYSQPEEFRGHLENGVLVVNPITLGNGPMAERKRELRFSRSQSGLSHKATILTWKGSEWTMEFNVRR